MGDVYSQSRSIGLTRINVVRLAAQLASELELPWAAPVNAWIWMQHHEQRLHRHGAALR